MVILVLIKKNVLTYTGLVFGMHANLTIDSADNPGGNPEIVPGDEQYSERQLKAGERVLTNVIREKK